MIRVNLIPAYRREALSQRRQVRAWAAILCAYSILLAMSCVIVSLSSKIDANAVARELTETKNKLKLMDTDSAAIKKQLAVIAEARRHTKAVSDHPDWSILLKELGSMMGTETSLKEIKLSPIVEQTKSAPTTAPSTQPVREQYLVELKGAGKSQPSVSKFVLQLQSTGLFDEVRLVKSARESKSNDAPVTFDLACTIGDLLQ